MKDQIRLSYLYFAFLALFLLLPVKVSAVYGATLLSIAATAPQLILTDSNIREWRIAGGFIYLTNTCTDGSSQTTAAVRRRATAGISLSTLESVNSAPECRTFRHAAVDESGIYYYNRNLGRLEAIFSDAPNDPPTHIVTIGDWTNIGSGKGISNLQLYGDYIYWMETTPQGEFTPDDIEIKRVPKNGGAMSTLISYAGYGVSVDGLGVTSRYIWWTDSDGLNRITNCGFIQLCPPGLQNKTIEFSTLSTRGHVAVSGSSVFWWNTQPFTSSTIRRTHCSLFGDCSTTSLHTAGTDTTVIGLAATTSDAFWTENVDFVGNRLRRKALTSGTAETLVEGISYSAPFVDVEGVYYRDVDSIYRLPFDAAAITRELGIAGWEITQGIQRLSNDVPLVAGKTTYARVYPKLESGADAGAVIAVLHGSRDGQPLSNSPLYPIDGSIQVDSSLTLAARTDVDGGWLFRLPEDWTRTGNEPIPQANTSITLRASIDPNGTYADSDSAANNEIQANFLFTAKAPTCMLMRPVRTHSPYQPTNTINVGQVLDLTESILPTPKLIAFPKNDPLEEIDWCWKGIFYGPFCSTPYELSDDDSGLLTKMGWLDFWSSSPSICWGNNARTLYAGIVHNDAPWDWGGLARVGKDQSLSKVPKYGKTISRFSGLAMTLVHELGHNYDRRHIDCGGPLSPDNGYPYPTNMLDFDLPLDDPSLHFGFDPLMQLPVNPNITADLMSYCGPEWYSDYTWKAIFNNTRDPIFVPPFSGTRNAGDFVYIAGAIDPENGLGTLDYGWTVPADQASDALRTKWTAALTPDWSSGRAISSYHLQLIGTIGQVLADQVIELVEVSDGNELAFKPFQVAFTDPAENVARVQLMDGDIILDMLSPGPASPSLVITQPVGGENIGAEIAVGWTASDPDSDDLLYTVLYSPNGGADWYPLLVNYGGSEEAEQLIALDLAGEPGSEGATALVRVMASDGYHTSTATSQPFSVAKRVPLPTVTSPDNDQVFAPQQTVQLHGFASDPEDGLVADDQFAWSYGESGQTAELHGLAPGTHDLELTVTDSDGQNGTDSIQFKVLPLSIPQTTASFMLDGRCDDEGYSSAPQLLLYPYADGARANARLIHTSSKMWLCLTELQGIGGYAGLLVDADNSQETVVQNGDFGYFVQQDGTPVAKEGNGSDFDSASVGVLSVRIVDVNGVWSAELQIDDSVFGSWERQIGLSVGHFGLPDNGAVSWPRSAESTNPASWGETNLGLMAQLESVDPESTLVGSGDFSLMLSGSNFDEKTVVLWGGFPLAITLNTSSTLVGEVPGSLVASTGIVEISVGDIDIAELTTGSLRFTVNNPQPSIASLTPTQAKMGSGDLVITIQGAGFVDGASVFWNGEERPALFSSPTQLRIIAEAADLIAAPKSISIRVVNPEPNAGLSGVATFKVLLQESVVIFEDGFE